MKSDISILQEHSISQDEVRLIVESLSSALGVMLVGSLSEGFANARSDVDLLAIIDDKFSVSDQSLIIKQDASTLAVRGIKSGHKLQVELLHIDKLRAMQDSARLFVREERDIALDPTKRPSVGTLPFLHMKLLHRFYQGMDLSGSSNLDDIRASFPLPDFSEYIGLVAQLDFIGAVEDYIGHIEQLGEKEAEAASIIATRCFLKLGLVLLSSVQQTNVVEKFTFRLLRAHAGELDEGLISRLLAAYRGMFAGGRMDSRGVLVTLDESIDWAVANVPYIARWYSSRGRTRLTLDGSWIRGRVAQPGVR
jgi:hypothetical protein